MSYNYDDHNMIMMKKIMNIRCFWKWKQARKARRRDSYLQIWNYESLTDWPTHPLTDKGRCYHIYRIFTTQPEREPIIGNYVKTENHIICISLLAL